MTQVYDAIVLGLGGMGSAALCELARRGRRVLGIEQFPLVHARGSSHGHTRIIRTAYYEHPDYVPLVKRAFVKWYELEQLTGRHLLTGCDCLTIGPSGGELVEGVRMSARVHALPVEELTAAEVGRRYPTFRVPGGMAGVVERGAGFLYVEECVRAHLDAAERCGAFIQSEEPVHAWRSDGRAVEVRTAKGVYTAANLVIAAGAWATELLTDLGVPLTVMRQTMQWYRTVDTDCRRDRFPIFLVDSPAGAFYGLPAIDPRGMKVARHYGAPELASPDQVDWEVTAADETPVRAFLNDVFGWQDCRRSAGQVCMYTLTPDRHFVIDLHPKHPNVAVAAGFSGHGFKFAPAVGEILADLVERGATDHPIGMFRADRFA